MYNAIIGITVHVPLCKQLCIGVYSCYRDVYHNNNY